MSVRRWIYGIDLKDRWGVNQAELADFVYEGGLNIYDPATRESHLIAEARAAYEERVNELDDRMRKKVDRAIREMKEYIFDNIYDFLFDNDEVIRFEHQHGLNVHGNKSTDLPQPETGQESILNGKNIQVPEWQTDPEQFIRTLFVFYENNEEIKIKAAGQPTKIYSHALLGFNRPNTKTWQALLEILQSRDHLYHLGAARGACKVRTKSYDANRKTLLAINEKFVSFLNKTYKQQLPDGFQIFERLKNGPAGTYKLKFTISDFSTEYANHGALSKSELIERIEKLSERKSDLKKAGDESSEKALLKIEDELNAAVVMAMTKKWLERNRANSYLNPRCESIYPDVESVYKKDKPYREDY